MGQRDYKTIAKDISALISMQNTFLTISRWGEHRIRLTNISQAIDGMLETLFTEFEEANPNKNKVSDTPHGATK